MYITINNIIGEKPIDLSHSIHSNKAAPQPPSRVKPAEITVITMLSDNIEYKIVKTHVIDYIPPGNVKQILSGTYSGRELLSILEGVIELTQFVNDEQVIKRNKLRGITEMDLNLNELVNSDNLEDGRPSNSLLTYHVTADKDFTHFEPNIPQYRRLKMESLLA